jgi:hypothetical protein
MVIEPQQARTVLGSLRLTLGVSALLAPRVVARLFGMPPEDNPQAPLLGRLFGIRNVAIGTELLQGNRGVWPQVNVAIDLVDAAAIVAGGVRGYLPRRTVILGTGTALLAAGLGAVAASGSGELPPGG